MSTLVEIRELILELTKMVEQILDTAGKPTGIEEASAKIIKEISDEINKCTCTKKIEEMLKDKASPPADKGKQVTEYQPPQTTDSPKYTFPNDNVGNAELGRSGNPDAVKWPPSRKE
uniref:Virion-associated protein n=1 Tax=Physostegia virginiana caulimovirus 2 TaxID=3075964 RepID=A0AA95Z1P9_9VIRU|nr:DNA-binding protein [Physostegia virginiana caulimovirus 2]